MRLFCYVLSVSLIGVSSAWAQDTRHVVEPRIPTACVVLKARIAAVGGVLPNDAEQNLDTDRIQQAIDQCSPGKAVRLQADRGKQTFLSGPLTLRSGVTLVIDANTALAASANPRLYDITAGCWWTATARAANPSWAATTSGAVV
jgi:polygalacturonase